MKYPESERVRSLRNNETFRTFSERFDTSASNIAAIESDKQGLSVPLARKMSEYYKVTLDWLYGITEEGGPKVEEKSGMRNVRDQIRESVEQLMSPLGSISPTHEKFYQKIIEEKDERIKLLEKYLEEQRSIIEHYKDIASKLSDKS